MTPQPSLTMRLLPSRIGTLICAAAGALALLALAACHPQPSRPVTAPEPFTGQLPEVEGVQAILSVRNPALFNQDLEKLMTAVPEAAMLRMGLGQLAGFGYPEFTEFAPDTNFGVAVLTFTADDLKQKATVLVGFAKLKEGGKLWTLLTQMNLVLQKHGDWVLVAKDQASLDKLKNPDAVTAFLATPQTEDLRLWGRASPELLASLKAAAAAALQPKLAKLPADEQKAATAYLDVAWSLAAQLHSASLAIGFGDAGLKVSYAAQFLPDSPIGTYLRYKPGPLPAVAQFVSGDALGAGIVHQDPNAASALTNSLFDAFLAVDYPPVSDSLKACKASYDAVWAEGDGGAAGVFTLAYTPAQAPKILTPGFFFTQSGSFDAATARAYFKTTLPLSAKLTKSLVGSMPAGLAPEINSDYHEDAASVAGASFDQWTMTNTIKGKEVSKNTEFVGVAGGNLVLADSEATLQAHLPALLAKTPLPDAINLPDQPGELGTFALNGAKVVDLLAAVAKLDLTDADTKAQVDGLKAAYVAGGPVTASINVGQAQGTFSYFVPYKFVEASVRLGTYMSAQHVNFASLFAGMVPHPASPPAPAQP